MLKKYRIGLLLFWMTVIFLSGCGNQIRPSSVSERTKATERTSKAVSKDFDYLISFEDAKKKYPDDYKLLLASAENAVNTHGIARRHEASLENPDRETWIDQMDDCLGIYDIAFADFNQDGTLELIYSLGEADIKREVFTLKTNIVDIARGTGKQSVTSISSWELDNINISLLGDMSKAAVKTEIFVKNDSVCAGTMHSFDFSGGSDSRFTWNYQYMRFGTYEWGDDGYSRNSAVDSAEFLINNTDLYQNSEYHYRDIEVSAKYTDEEDILYKLHEERGLEASGRYEDYEEACKELYRLSAEEGYLNDESRKKIMLLTDIESETRRDYIRFSYESDMNQEWKKYISLGNVSAKAYENRDEDEQQAALPGITYGEFLQECGLDNVEAIWYGDVTGDGKNEVLLCFSEQVLGSDGYSMELYSLKKDRPVLIYQCRTADVHSAWESLYFFPYEGQYCIFVYNPAGWNGYLDYSMKLIKLDEEGNQEQVFYDSLDMDSASATEEEKLKKQEFENHAAEIIGQSDCIIQYGEYKPIISGKQNRIGDLRTKELIEKIAPYREKQRSSIKAYANLLARYDVPGWNSADELTEMTALMLYKGIVETGYLEELPQLEDDTYTVTRKDLIQVLNSCTAVSGWENVIAGLGTETIASGEMVTSEFIGEMNRFDLFLIAPGVVTADIGWSNGGWQSMTMTFEEMPKLCSYSSSF